MTDCNGARTLTGAAPLDIEKVIRDFLTSGHRSSLDGLSKGGKQFPMAPAEIVSTTSNIANASGGVFTATVLLIFIGAIDRRLHTGDRCCHCEPRSGARHDSD